jgi:surface antigen
MREWRLGATAFALGSVLILGCSSTTLAAPASKHSTKSTTAGKSIHAGSAAKATQRGKYATTSHGKKLGYTSRATYVKYGAFAQKTRTAQARGRYRAQSYGISCVPYARAVSGIELAGNAWQWWQNAAGTYARGHTPEPGSVLSFRNNHRMPMGHVAVVRHIVNSRQIVIDHANWPTGGGRGGVARNVTVVDVSDLNDWSAVRVELGRSGDYGSVYPANGFIYNRPDTGVILAATRHPAPLLALNPAPSDLRPAASRRGPSQRVAFEEVAEAPRHGRSTVVLAPSGDPLSAPQRFTLGN